MSAKPHLYSQQPLHPPLSLPPPLCASHPWTPGFIHVCKQHSIQTCPLLDVLLIGGPTLAYRPSAAVQAFLQSQYTHVHAFITVCTGYTAALFAGILDGKSATAPQGLIPGLKKGAPAVKWVEKRWVRDGKGEPRVLKCWGWLERQC